MVERQNEIEDSLDSAERMNKRAEAKLKKYDSMMEDANRQGKRILREAKKAATADADQIVERARGQADMILMHARNEANEEIKKAKETMSVEIADIAIDVAGKILDRELDKEKHHEVIKEAIKEAGEKCQE